MCEFDKRIAKIEKIVAKLNGKFDFILFTDFTANIEHFQVLHSGESLKCDIFHTFFFFKLSFG